MTKLNLAEIKERLDDLVDRVSETGETILFLQSGKPVAKLVPAGSEDVPSHLVEVEGWLEDSDPFFAAIDEIVEARSQRRFRVLRENKGLDQALQQVGPSACGELVGSVV